MPAANGHSTEDIAPPIDSLILPPDHALAVQRSPEIVLEEAKRAAKALQKIIDAKPNRVVINEKTYLVYEDWQMLGRFYGLTAAARSTHFVEFGETRGFEATAEILLISTNQVISGAEAMCLDDEYKWSDKPLFQLKSMAQTRACAKAFRNVLSWVAVLAGYAPTPAEELDEEQGRPPVVSSPRRRSDAPSQSRQEPVVTTQRRRQTTSPHDQQRITDKQLNRLFAIARDCNVPKNQLRAYVMRYGFAEEIEITVDKYQFICAEVLGQEGN